MDRIIKFKAKGLDDWDWKEGNLVVTDLIGCDAPITEIITTDEMRYEVDPSTICQFTGLKDRDGKEIWEGDIVIRYSDQGDITAYVVWENESCRYTLVNTRNKYDTINSLRYDTLKVIGNRYDECDILS